MSLREILELKLFTVNEFSFTTTHIVSVLIILAVSRLIVYLVRLFLKRSLKRRQWLDSGKEYALSQIIKYLVYTIALVLILETFGVDVTILITSSAALFVGIGLGLQDIFKDIISSFFLLFERSVVGGDVVEMEGIVGCVQEINIRTSKIKTKTTSPSLFPTLSCCRTR